MTEEEIRDMQRRAAWEEAAAAAQKAKERKDVASREDPGPAPNMSVDPRSPVKALPITDDFVRSNAPLLGSPLQNMKDNAVAGAAFDAPPPPPTTPAGFTPSAPAPNDPFGIGAGGPPKTPTVNIPSVNSLPVREVNGAPAVDQNAPPGQNGVPGGIGPARPPTTDDPLDLSGGAAGGGGGRGILIPGRMQRASEEREVKEGHPVRPEVKEAYGAAASLGLRAGEVAHDATSDLLRQQEGLERMKLDAMDTARLQHQRLEEDRARLVQDRLGEIESLNKQAQGKPEDLWSNGQIFARVVGTILAGVGFVTAAKGGHGSGAGIGMLIAGKTLNRLVDEDIQNKLIERNAAGAQAKRQTDLLHLHLDNMKDQDKAIDATKLAYYDNILQNMEALKAGPYGQQINDANYLKLQQQVLDDRAKTVERIDTKEQADISGKSISKMTKPQLLGGPTAGVHPGIRDHERVITIPASDRTGEHEIHVAVPVEMFTDLAKKSSAANEIILLDREALAKRAELRRVLGDGKMDTIEKAQRAATIRSELSKAWLQRVHAEQKAEGEGVTRKEDFEQAKDMGLDYTAGIGGNDVLLNTDKAIQHSSNLTAATMDGHIRGVGGWVVKPTVVTEHEKGEKGPHGPGITRPGFEYTGQMYRGRPVAPEGDVVK